MWHVDLAIAIGKILLMQGKGFLNLCLESGFYGGWQQGSTVLVSLALTNCDCVQGKINIFDT